MDFNKTTEEGGDRDGGGGEEGGGDRGELEGGEEDGGEVEGEAEGEEKSQRAAVIAPRVHLGGNLTMINDDMLIAHMRGWWGGGGSKRACFAVWFRDLFCRGRGWRVEEAKRLGMC